jgi:geranylgeranyl reductase family protein
MAQAVEVVVAGSGPAGAVAALVLARAGARTLLVDPSEFPRDKACGDVVGPRGVQALDELGIAVPGARPSGAISLLGPSGRRVDLPWPRGRDYPDLAFTVPRRVLDAHLHEEAVRAGATPCRARVAGVEDGGRAVRLSGGQRVRTQFVIGADGAMSPVAATAGLLDPARALWGFALREYRPRPVDRLWIAFWEPRPWRALPGYGWLFPGPDGGANLGVGVGLGPRRAGANLAAGSLAVWEAWLARAGLAAGAGALDRRGGWLRMAGAGSLPGRGRVLLAGDAAGLVNPLQGEGIAEALLSGRSAGDAVIAHGDGAAEAHRQTLARAHGRFQAGAGALHALLVRHPRALAAAARVLTAPGVGRALAGGWSVYWNDLLDGAAPGRSRTVARGLDVALRRTLGAAGAGQSMWTATSGVATATLP